MIFCFRKIYPAASTRVPAVVMTQGQIITEGVACVASVATVIRRRRGGRVVDVGAHRGKMLCKRVSSAQLGAIVFASAVIIRVGFI